MYCRETQMLGSEGSQTVLLVKAGKRTVQRGKVKKVRRRQVHHSEQQRAEAKQLLRVHSG